MVAGCIRLEETASSPAEGASGNGEEMESPDFSPPSNSGGDQLPCGGCLTGCVSAFPAVDAGGSTTAFIENVKMFVEMLQVLCVHTVRRLGICPSADFCDSRTRFKAAVFLPFEEDIGTLRSCLDQPFVRKKPLPQKLNSTQKAHRILECQQEEESLPKAAGLLSSSTSQCVCPASYGFLSARSQDQGTPLTTVSEEECLGGLGKTLQCEAEMGISMPAETLYEGITDSRGSSHLLSKPFGEPKRRPRSVAVSECDSGGTESDEGQTLLEVFRYFCDLLREMWEDYGSTRVTSAFAQFDVSSDGLDHYVLGDAAQDRLKPCLHELPIRALLGLCQSYPLLTARLRPQTRHRLVDFILSSVYAQREATGAQVLDRLLCHALSLKVSVLSEQGQYGEALERLDEALPMHKEVFGAEHLNTVALIHKLAGVFLKQGRHAEAMEKYEEVLQVTQRKCGNHHLSTAAIVHNMAVVLEAQENYDEAMRRYSEALRVYEAVLGDEHPDTASAFQNMCSMLKGQGRYAQAMRMEKETFGDSLADSPATQREVREHRQKISNPNTEKAFPSHCLLIKFDGCFEKSSKSMNLCPRVSTRLLKEVEGTYGHETEEESGSKREGQKPSSSCSAALTAAAALKSLSGLLCDPASLIRIEDLLSYHCIVHRGPDWREENGDEDGG
uniref:Uncharacterized protein n=1 Tax=Chromera velia CCMP2878 TaxID=1169474 RepID=A0A0G4I737_9ALVE|eukprot:Cvel_11586.t1-p1 / transcript=Cvel_11586.t1 / gene=Cvel_11586 / organism=Chromera_velia_CCMP2878 / gene_product=Kinesin light chain 3, putative / transcript_product=Kinesin light chain 3, putative / location=Cvel_scaffold733:4296-6669(+) / protein_length=670 / sequence_SO=supercontig / SO=protein_coding / is_pseudo=false